MGAWVRPPDASRKPAKVVTRSVFHFELLLTKHHIPSCDSKGPSFVLSPVLFPHCTCESLLTRARRTATSPGFTAVSESVTCSALGALCWPGNARQRLSAPRAGASGAPHQVPGYAQRDAGHPPIRATGHGASPDTRDGTRGIPRYARRDTGHWCCAAGRRGGYPEEEPQGGLG